VDELFRIKSRPSYSLKGRGVKAGAVAAIVLALAALGCPGKDEAAKEAPVKSAPSVEVGPGSGPRAYRTVAVENGRTIGVHVQRVAPKAAPAWPVPAAVRSQCGGVDHVVDEALSASPNGGANGAVVWLDDVHEGRALAPAAATLDQKRCVFAPHILAVPAAGTLTLTNGDPANHADRFEFGGDGSLDFMKTLPGGGSVGVPIQSDWGGRIARVSCPIHLWMGGYALFFAHPYFAVTEAGVARLEGVPKGTYHLTVWHEGTTSTFDSSIKLAPPQTARVELVVGDTDVKRAFVIATDGTITQR
jgi:hypothetical protein